MGRRYELRRHDRDEVNIDIGRYPGRSSSKRHVYSSGNGYGGTSSHGSGAKVSLRGWVGIFRFVEV